MVYLPDSIKVIRLIDRRGKPELVAMMTTPKPERQWAIGGTANVRALITDAEQALREMERRHLEVL